MVVEKEHDEPARSRLSAKSAYKSLELVLYQLTHHIKDPVQFLLSKGSLFDNDVRFSISQIKESLDNLVYMLKSTLKERASIGDGDFSYANGELYEKVQVDTVLRALATTTSISDSEEFYRFCVKTMAQLYGCKFAFIGRLINNGEDVRTLAVWTGDNFAENFEYNLHGTPCADILSFNKELIPTAARTLYPEDELLTQMGVDSYYGAPILSKEKGVMGLISVMDTKPMQPTEWTTPILGVFASRLALEIERGQAIAELSDLNNSLEARIHRRTKALETANDELKAFSYSVSHDLRSPIRSINSFSEILQQDHGHELSEQANQIVNRIINAGKRLDKITNDLLRLSKISNAELTIKKIDVSSMVKEIISILSEQAPHRKLQLSIEPGIFTWADEKLLRIALENLLGNAWKYTRNNELTLIEFGLKPDSDGKIFYLRDNGVGFDETYIKKLFIPFERLHSDTEFEGSGIGLATTLRAISRHGGDIWAESKVGKGACFFFNLGQAKPIHNK